MVVTQMQEEFNDSESRVAETIPGLHKADKKPPATLSEILERVTSDTADFFVSLNNKRKKTTIDS